MVGQQGIGVSFYQLERSRRKHMLMYLNVRLSLYAVRSYVLELYCVARPVKRLDIGHYAIGPMVLGGMLDSDWLKVALIVYDLS